jgi:hypothetical protein
LARQRFHSVNTCALVPCSSVEPLIVNDEDYRLWIWRSSLEEKTEKKWENFSPELRRQWATAFDEADMFADVSPRLTPSAVRFPDCMRGAPTARKVGYLQPGTVVWTCLTNSPPWPAMVVGVSPDEHMDLIGRAGKDETEPLMFFSDPDQTAPMYSSTHSCYGFSADPVWIEHMRARAQHARIHDKKISAAVYREWEEACNKVFDECKKMREKGDS